METRISKTTKLLTILAFAALTGSVQSQEIRLLPTTPTADVLPGDTVSFDIIMDFSAYPNGTIGGGFDIVFDSGTLQFASLFRDGSIGDPGFGRDPDIFVGLLESWAVADFFPLPPFATLGSVDFEVLPSASSTAVCTQATDGIGGPWIDAADFQTEIPVLYSCRSVTPVSGPDSDGDTVPDNADNCIDIPNTDQRDTNGDNIGNICDPDLNNDCSVNFIDLNAFKAVFFTPSADADLDGSGLVNFVDLDIVKQHFFGSPGPSGIANDCGGSTVLASENFGDGVTPSAGGWSFGGGGAVPGAGDEGGDDHALVYTANRDGQNGFNVLHPFMDNSPNSGFLGNYLSPEVTHVQFKARHNGVGDTVHLRVVLFDTFDNGVDWAMTPVAATVSNTATGWQTYTLAIDPDDLLTGGSNGLSALQIMQAVEQISLRHDPAGTGPTSPSSVANPTSVTFDDISLISGTPGP